LKQIRNRHPAVLVVSVIAVAGCAKLGPISPLGPLERALLYQPAHYPRGDWQPEGLAVEDAWFESADGTRLHGWFVAHPHSRAVVLFLHGNAGNVSHRAETLRILNQRHSLAVFAPDYRGFGRSEGKPNEKGILADARAARAWLAARTGVHESDIVLMGRSLGGAVAVDLAAKDCARGLVLASTFTSLPNVAAKHFGWASPRLNMTQRLDSLSKIPNYGGILLVSHGDADRTIPFSHGAALFEAAPGPKKFVTIRGGDHNDPQSEEYRHALDEFLAALPPIGQHAIQSRRAH
jgi:hypothetical protein